ncbi:hypothetical protein AB0M12_41725 [Nocardia vinacea]|uniref:hypothetical protein n=1 Tax=Nocardia vinacea TaxID=96468 RepID=UPI003412B803
MDDQNPSESMELDPGTPILFLNRLGEEKGIPPGIMRGEYVSEAPPLRRNSGPAHRMYEVLLDLTGTGNCDSQTRVRARDIIVNPPEEETDEEAIELIEDEG